MSLLHIDAIGEMAWSITLYECSYQQRHGEKSCTCNPLELKDVQHCTGVSLYTIMGIMGIMDIMDYNGHNGHNGTG